MSMVMKAKMRHVAGVFALGGMLGAGLQRFWTARQAGGFCDNQRPSGFGAEYE